MVLNLKRFFDLPGETKSFDYQVPLESLEQYKGCTFVSPIAIKGALTNRAGIVTIDNTVTFTLKHNCDRCLKEFTREYSFDFSHILVRSTNHQNDEFIVCADSKLDVDELAISDLLLQLPSKTLCKDDCKGLCCHCGADLNIGECSCAKE